MSEELPEGWESSTVGSLFTTNGGGTPNRGEPSYWGGTIPWLSSGDIKSSRLSGGSEFITPEGLDNSSARLCERGTVIVVTRSGILKHTLPVAILDEPAAINQDIRSLDCGNVALNEWLALSLRAYSKQILEQNREGTTVESVKTETLKGFVFPIPPLAEQRRIVAAVERILAEVGAARERLGRVPATLKRFRQSVLAAACSGRLTAVWRATHPGDSVDTSDELPSSWRQLELADIIEGLKYGTSKKSEFGSKGVPWNAPGKVDTGLTVIRIPHTPPG